MVDAVILSSRSRGPPTFTSQKGQPLASCRSPGSSPHAIEPADLPSRISVLSALFLTVYAIQYGVTIERLPRLPFSTIYDGVAQKRGDGPAPNDSRRRLRLVQGRRPAGGCSGECGDDFDTQAAERWDAIFAVLVACYIVFYSFAYHVLWQSRKVEDMYGWTRPWKGGPNMSNKWFNPKEGQTWRLYTSEEWADVHTGRNSWGGEAVSCDIW